MNLHIIHEASSPPEAGVWTMWCGTKTLALDDGTLVPTLDFYPEVHAAKATCPACIVRYLAHGALRIESVST